MFSSFLWYYFLFYYIIINIKNKFFFKLDAHIEISLYIKLLRFLQKVKYFYKNLNVYYYKKQRIIKSINVVHF